MTKQMITIALTAWLSTAAGCLDASDDPAVTETQAELGVGDHACVRQSTASAVHTTNPFNPPSPCGVPGATLSNANTQLSFGHPVAIRSTCGLTPQYVFVQSLWNTASYYTMRADALGGC